jgi:hypothetical protein
MRWQRPYEAAHVVSHFFVWEVYNYNLRIRRGTFRFYSPSPPPLMLITHHIVSTWRVMGNEFFFFFLAKQWLVWSSTLWSWKRIPPRLKPCSVTDGFYLRCLGTLSHRYLWLLPAPLIKLVTYLVLYFDIICWYFLGYINYCVTLNVTLFSMLHINCFIDILYF